MKKEIILKKSAEHQSDYPFEWGYPEFKNGPVVIRDKNGCFLKHYVNIADAEAQFRLFASENLLDAGDEIYYSELDEVCYYFDGKRVR